MALLVLLLAACAATTPGKAPDSAAHTADWHTQQTQLAALTVWRVSGKIALRSANASESARINWQQQEDNSRIKLNGPLGIGAMDIESDGQTLVITQGKDVRILDVSTPEAVFINTGWELPLQALPYWLKGLPSPDFPIDELTLNAQGKNIERLAQNGWLISYTQYADAGPLSLPAKVVAERDDMRLKLILQTWSDLAQ